MTILSDLTSRKTNPSPPCLVTSVSTSRVAVREGDDAFLLVLKGPGSGPILDISWAKGSRQLVGDRYHVGENNNSVHLTLQGITRDDEGEYTVTAKNIAGESRSAVYLRIKDGPFDDDEAPIFLRRLNDLAVKVGTRTRFLVEIRSSSDVQVTWHRNEIPIPEEDRFHFLHEGNFFCVDVAPVSIEDSGRWSCVAENSTARSSCSCRLNVLIPKAYRAPEFLEQLRAVLTEQGTVSLECKVVGVPTPILRWYKDGKEIKPGDMFALTANPDDPTSLGMYTCEATNCMGKTYSSSRVHVSGRGSREGSLLPADHHFAVGPPPIFKKELRNERVKIGTAVTLSCQVSVPPWPKTINWYNKEGKIESSEKYHIMEDGLGGYSIEIYPLEADDEGEWKCVATSDTGVMTISTCTVSMTYPKNYRKPKFLESLKAILTEEGLVSFECKVVGFPTPRLQWFKDGQELRPGDVYQLTGTNSLGSYSCIARNCMGEARSTAELTVEDIQSQLNEEEKLHLFSKNQPPRFIRGLKSCEAKINEDFRFTVQVTLSPEANLSWYRDDEKIENDERYSVVKENVGVWHLYVKGLEVRDQAEWKCVAANEFGQSITTGFLKLTIPKHYKKPKFLECLRAILSEEGAVNLECKVIGVPQPVLKWYKDGKELKPGDIHRIISGQDGKCCLGTYTCEARNCMGSVSSSASLLGFEDRKAIKEMPRYIPEPLYPLAKNTSLSTIHEERTSQLYDTPGTEHSITMDERGDVSFSFDGKEVSISLYETPDLTEEEALKVVEMYAEELSEHISEQNVVELPPMRFTKESSKSGPLLMEAVVIDVSEEYFSTADDDLRTEADFEDVSMAEEAAHNLPSPEMENEAFFEKINSEFLEKALASLSGKEQPQKRSSDKSDSYKSLSSPKKGSVKGSREEMVTAESKPESSDGLRRDNDASSSGKKEEKTKKKKSRSRSASTDSKNQSYDEKVEEGVVIITPKRASISRSSSGGSDEKRKTQRKSRADSVSREADENVTKKRRSSRSASESLDETIVDGLKKRRGSRSRSQSGDSEATETLVSVQKKKKKVKKTSSSEESVEKQTKKEDGTCQGKPEEVEAEKKRKMSSSSSELPPEDIITKKPAEVTKKKKTRSRSSSLDRSERRKSLEKIKQKQSEEEVKEAMQKKESVTVAKGEVKTVAKGVESSLKEIHEALSVIEEKMVQETAAPKRDMIHASFQELQNGLQTIEEQIKKEEVTEKVLQELVKPVQDFEVGMKLAAEQQTPEESYEMFSLVTNEMRQQLKTAAAKLSEASATALATAVATLVKPIAKLSQTKTPESMTSVELLQNLAQPVQELQEAIETAKEQHISKTEVLSSLSEPLETLKTAITLVEEKAETEVSGKILKKVSRPIAEISQGIKVIESQITTEHVPEDSFEALSQPIQDLHRGLAEVVQDVLFSPVHVTTLSEIAQSAGELLQNLEEPQSEELLGQEQKRVIFSCLKTPLTTLRDAIAVVKEILVPENVKEVPPEVVKSNVMQVLKKPVADFRHGLLTIEGDLNHMPPELGVEVNKENILQIVKDMDSGLQEITKADKPVTEVFQSLSVPLQNLKACLSEKPKTRHPLSKSSSSLGKSLDLIRQGSDDERAESEELKINLSVLRPLEKPLQDLEEGFGLLEQHILRKERIPEREKPVIEGQLQTLLEILSQSFEVFQEKWVTIEGSRKGNASAEEANALLELINELKNGTETIQSNLTELETISPATKNMIKSGVYSNLKNLSESIGQVEALIVQESLQAVPELKLLISTVRESVSALHDRHPESRDVLRPILQVETNLEKMEIEEGKPGTGKSVLDEIVEKTVEKFKNDLNEAEKVLLQEDPTQNPLFPPFEALKKEVEEQVKSGVTMSTLTSISRSLETFAMEIKSGEPTKNDSGTINRVIDLIKQNVVVMEKPTAQHAEISIVMKQPLEKLQHSLEQIQASQGEITDVKSIAALQELEEPLKNLKKGLEDTVKAPVETTQELTVPVKMKALANTIVEMQKGIADVLAVQSDTNVLDTLTEPLRQVEESLTKAEECIKHEEISSLVPEVTQALKANLKPELAQALISLQECLATGEDVSTIITKVTGEIEKASPEEKKSLLKLRTQLEGVQQELNAADVEIKLPKKKGDVLEDAVRVLQETVVELFKDEGHNLTALTVPIYDLGKALVKVEKGLIDSREVKKSLSRMAESLQHLEDMPKTGEKLLSNIQEKLAAIESVTMAEELRELPKLVEALTKEFHELHEAVITTEETLTSEAQTIASVTKAIAQPMQELQHKLAEIKEHVKLETAGNFESAILETMAEPVEKLQTVFQQQAMETSETTADVDLKQISQPVFELEKALAQVVLTAANKEEEEVVKSVAKPIQELVKEVATIQEQMIMEPETISVSAKTDLSILQTLAKPAEELQKIVAVVQQCQLVETEAEPISSLRDSTIAEPIESLRHGLEQLQNVILEATCAADCLEALTAVAEPIRELQHHFAAVQSHECHQDEMMVPAADVELARKLATPVHDLACSLVVVQQQLVEGEASSFSQTLVEPSSLLATIIKPEELERMIAVVEQCQLMEPEAASLSSLQEATLADTVRSLRYGLEQLEEVLLEGTNPTECMSALEAVAKPIRELGKCIATMQTHEAFSEENAEPSKDLDLVMKMATPIQELVSGLVVLQQQFMEAGIKSQPDILEMAKASTANIITPFEKLAALEEMVLDAEGATMSQVTNLEEATVHTTTLHEIAGLQTEEAQQAEELKALHVESAPAESAVSKEEELERKRAAMKEEKVLESLEKVEPKEESAENTDVNALKVADIKGDVDSEKQESITSEYTETLSEVESLSKYEDEPLSEKADLELVKADNEKSAVEIAEEEHIENIEKTEGKKVSKKAEEGKMEKIEGSELKQNEMDSVNQVKEAEKKAANDAEDAAKSIMRVDEEKAKKETDTKAESEAKKNKEEEDKKIAEADAKKKAEEDETKTKAEAETKKREQEEAMKKEKEEEAKKKAEQEEVKKKAEAEALKKKKEEETRKKAEEEETETKAEAEAKKKKEEEEAKMKAEDEEAKKKADAEAKKKKEVEEEAEKKAKAEEEMKIKDEQEEAKKKVDCEEKKKEEGDKKVEEEETKKKAEAGAKKKKEEEKAKKEAEEDKAKMKAEEEEGKKKAETEAQKKKEEETKKKAEEEETKNKAEAEAMKKEEEKAKIKKEDEENRMKAEEAEARQKAEAEAEAKKNAEEEIVKKKDESEKKAEAEVKGKTKQEEEKKTLEEEEAKKEIEPNAEPKKKKQKDEEDAKNKADAAAQEKKEEEEENKKANAEAEVKKKQEGELARKKDEEEAKDKIEEEAKKKREDEEETKKKTETDAKKKKEEEKAKKAEEEEIKKNAEAETKKKEDEEAMKKKKEEEEDKAKKKADAEAEKKKEEEAKEKAEAEAMKKKEEEDKAKKKAEEEEVKKKAEAEAKKKKEEAEAKKKKEDEEKAKKEAEAEEAARKKKEEEEANKRAEVEDMKKKEEEDAKKKAEAEAKKKKKEEDEAKKKAEEEEARKKADAEAKKKQEEEEKKKKAEADAKKKKEEEEIAKKKSEEEEAKKKAEAEALKKKEEEDKAKKKAEEEEVKKKAEAEAKKKKEEEEAKEKAEAEAKKKKQEEENKKKEEEEAKKKAAEEEAKKKAQEEEAKKKAEAEAIKKKEEDEKKKAEEEAKKKKEEEETKKKAEAEEAKKKAEAETKKKQEEDEMKKKQLEEAKKKAEEEEAKKKAEAEAKKKKEEEEEAKKKAEEEEAKKKAEAEAKQKQEEEEARKKEEEEAKQKAEAEAKKKKQEEEARKKAEVEAKKKAEAEAKQKQEEEEARKKEEEEAKQKAEAEARKKKEEEEAKKKAEEEEAKKKAEVEAKKKKEEEEAKKKKEEEEKAKKKAEEEEAKKKAEAEAKKKKEEVEAKKKSEEEEAKKKKEEEETKKKAEAEAKRKQEEEEKKKKEEEEEVKKRAEAEAKKKKEEEEAKKKAEEEAKKKKEEEEIAKKKAEEEEAKKKAEAEAKKKIEEEEAKKKAEAEAKKKKEEEETKKKAEAEAKKKQEEEEKKKKEEEEEVKKRAEAEAKKKKEKEEAKKKAEEEAKKKKEEEEIAKKKAEAEAKKKKQEEEEKKKKEEEEAKKKQEEEEKKKKEEEEAKTKAEAEAKKKAEEEAKKKKEEEEANKKREEEEKKKKEEEEAKTKAEAEAKKKKEEEEAKKKAEAEAKKKKEDEEIAKKKAEEEEAKKKAEADAKKKKEEEAKKNKVDEEAEADAKKKVDEEKQKKKADEEKPEEKKVEPENGEKPKRLKSKKKKANEELLIQKQDNDFHDTSTTIKKDSRETQKIKDGDTFIKRETHPVEATPFSHSEPVSHTRKRDKSPEEVSTTTRRRREPSDGKKESEGFSRDTSVQLHTEAFKGTRFQSGSDETLSKRGHPRSVTTFGKDVDRTYKLEAVKVPFTPIRRRATPNVYTGMSDWHPLNRPDYGRSLVDVRSYEEHRKLHEMAKRDLRRLTTKEYSSSVEDISFRLSAPELSMRQEREVPRERKGRPVVCSRLVDRTAPQGSTVKLTCTVLGNPEPTIKWLRDGIPLGNRYKEKVQDGIASLEIENASQLDNGEYTCHAENTHGEVTTSCKLKIYHGYDPAPYPPSFTSTLKESYKFTEDELTLECRVKCHPPAKVQWSRNGVPIRPSSRYQQAESSDGTCKLIISGPEADDSGDYTCRAENQVGEDATCLRVKFPGRQHYAEARKTRSPKDFRKPHFRSELTDHLVPAGGTIALQVEVRGMPIPEVKWLRGNEELPRTSSKVRAFEDAGVYTLLVPNATEKEAGLYSCHAYNAFGHIRTTAAVQVLPVASVRGGKPPKIVNRPKDIMTANVEDDVIITCRVTGDPKPRVSWLKGTKDITITQRTMVDHTDDYFRFTLKKVVPADAGTYWIIAKNVHGHDRAFVTLQVKQRARSLTPGGFSSSRWEWEAPPNDSSEILSEIHDREKYSRRETPGPISSEPYVADSGRNWLTLSWKKPGNRGGAPVIGYRVDAWETGRDGGARWTELGITPVNTFDAFNLKNGKEYKFRVTPRNRYGWGEPLITSQPIAVGYRATNMPEFTKILPGQLKALFGSSVRLECHVNSILHPRITWYRDGVPVDETSPRITSEFDGTVCCLVITDLVEDDSGRYMCEAVNKIGRASTFARLMIVDDPKVWEADLKLKRGVFDEDGIPPESPPQFTMRLRDRRVQMTYPVRLTCQVVGSPTPTVKWYHEGKELKQDDRHAFSSEDHFHTLEMSKTFLEDAGCYTATAINDYGSISCRCNLVVDKGIRAYVAPEFVHELEVTKTVRSGDELRLKAQVEAYPSVGVVWHRNGVRLRPSRRIIMTLTCDGTVELTVAAVTEKDSGVYACTATNEVGRSETSCRVAVRPHGSQTLSVPTIRDPNLPYSKAPIFIKKPRSNDAVEGDTIYIECQVVGDPKPEVLWLRDFLKPEYYRDAPHFIREGEGPDYRLEIPHAKLDYTGTYSVVARNVHGEVKAVTSLQIFAKGQGKEDRMDRAAVTHGNVETLPIFTKGLKDVRCCDGDSVTFECAVEAATPPEIKWRKRGKLLPLGEDFVAEFDGRNAKLTITQVYPEDEGEYSCEACNDLGKNSTSACLVVDVPEEKENLLSRQLTRPPGLMSGCSTPRSTPRTTPSRSTSPYPVGYRYRSTSPSSRPKRFKVTPPKFYAVPHNRVAQEGETVRFQCAVAGHPIPWVTWDKDGCPVNPTARITISEKEDLKILEISEVTVEDAGLYRIVVENDVGRIEATARLEVIGPNAHKSKVANVRAWSASPAFRRRLVSSVGRVGGNLTLGCDIRSSPNPVTSWYRNGDLIVRTKRITPTWNGETAMLEIENLEKEDAGVYTCVAENEFGRCQCSAEVVVKDDEPGVEPEFVEGLSDVVAEEGNPLEFKVKVKGDGPLDVVWAKDGTEIPDCEDFRYVDYGDGRFGLRIADAFIEDSGEYSCDVFNQYGDSSSSARLWVKENAATPAIVFSKKPTSVVVACGKSAAFCSRIQQSGSERAVISWSLNGRDIPKNSSGKYTIEEDGDVSILHISCAEQSDSGRITCTARYECRECDGGRKCTCRSTSASCSAELTVLSDNWASDSECDTIKCRDTRLRSLSTGEIEADLLKMSKDSTGYSVAKDGASRALILRGPADKNVFRGVRVVLSATYCGQPEPQVRWMKGGHKLENGDRIGITAGDGETSLTIDSISSDDSGKYVVYVENDHGSDRHFASLAVEGPPEPPSSNPTVHALSTESAKIEWSGPAFDGGCKITGYVIEMKSETEPEWKVAAVVRDSFSHVVKDLRPEEKYKFRVRAENVHGRSEPGAESVQISLRDGLPPQFEPRNVTIEDGDLFKARYEVLEELGKGRFGVVHKVADVETGQKLAAKFIRCITVKDREKVKEEIDIMNCLRHPKLLQLAAAFESSREMVMVMEYISGGELFERVVADDFQLTERDCILFMRQICEGVRYMHENSVVHLDLKPENIMCQTRTSHEIKLIDFGLAQRLDPEHPVRVLFGTPEFVPPEVINYEPIGFESDMWSVGVICYVLLSGLSPFMGENDAETFANITRASYDFDEEAFAAISQDAKDFISSLLVKRKEKRLTASECLRNKWMLSEHDQTMGVILSTDKLKKFIIRRKWQKTGNAIRALGRLATLSAASRKNSGSNSSQSVSKVEVGHVEKETDYFMDACGNTSSPLTKAPVSRCGAACPKTQVSKADDKSEIRSRLFSERSDSGISDCSSSSGGHAHSCHTPTSITPLFAKKYCISENVISEVPDIVRDSSRETIGSKVDVIRRKFASLSKNIDEMDKKLETVGRKLVDIGPGKLAQSAKPEIKRVPSLKDSKPSEVRRLMQPTASSQAKTSSPRSPVLNRKENPPGLTVPVSPDLRTAKLSRVRQAVGEFDNSRANSCVSPTVKRKKPDGVKSHGKPDVTTPTLGRRFDTRPQQPDQIKGEMMRKDLEIPAKENANIRSGSLKFQKAVAFWKR